MSKVYAVATELKKTFYQITDTLINVFAAFRERNRKTFSHNFPNKLTPVYTTTTHQNKSQMQTLSQDTTKSLNGFNRWVIALTIMLVAMTFPFGKSFGQNITNYAFATNNNGSLEDLTTGSTSILTGNNDDAAGTVTPIGFNFIFMGVPYSHFSANSNGQMLLHTSSGATAAASQQSTLTTGLAILAPFAGDNEVNNGIRIKLIGTAPNRKLVIEWNQFYVNFVNLTNAGNMQVWLQEGTGVVTYVYGEIYNSASSSQTRSIFIASGASATTAGSITINASPTAPTFAASATLATNTIALGSGTTTGSPLIDNIGSSSNTTRRFFSFTPPAAAPADPITLTFTAVTSSTTTVNWVDNSTNEVGFIVTRATDAGFTSNVVVTSVASTTSVGTATAYSSIQSGLTPGFTYYYKVQAVTEGQASTGLTGNQAAAAAAVYYYTGLASGDLATVGNWNTAADGTGTVRTAATTDILIVDGAGTTPGAAVTLTMAAAASIGALQITSNTALTIQATTTTQRVLTLTGSVGDELSVPAGSSLLLNNATLPVGIAFSTGSGMTGTIAGTLTFAGSTSNNLTTTGGTGTIVTVTSTGIVNNGVTAASGTLTGSAATLVFANGSTLNVTGATTGAPALPLATWGASSNINISGITTSTTAPTNNAQTFGNITYNSTTSTATMSFFGTSTTAVIQGNLTIQSTNTGIFRILTSGALTINGNLVLNGGSTQIASSSTGALIVLGNTTIASGATMDLNAGSLSQRGTTFTNNGVLTGTASTCTLAFFSPTNIAQTFAGTGTVTTNIGTLSIQNTSGVTITHTNQIPLLRVNLFQGTLTNSNKLTIGTGAALATTVQIGSTGLTTSGGSFSATPTFNLGTGTYAVLYQYETTARSTGFEIPTTRAISAATIGNPNNVTVAGGALSIGTLTLQAGNLITTTVNLATITGTTTTSTVRTAYTSTAASSSGTTVTITSTTGLFVGMNVTVTAGTGAFATNTTVTSIPSTTTFVVSAAPSTALSAATVAGIGGWVSGPLALTIPASLATGSTYNFPIGKSSYKNFELVNPVTGAGGTYVAQAEVFDASAGGTAGSLIGTINTTRYWAASTVSGGANLTSTAIRLNDVPAGADAIAGSATKTGAYSLVGGVSSTITASSILTGTPNPSSLVGFYVMGNKAAASISNLAISPTGNLCSNATRTVTVTVTPGGAAISSVVINYSINGTAQTAITMTNTTGNGGLVADNWSGVIPTVVPANATVAWSVTATDANTLAKSATGTSYNDAPLASATATAVASVTTVCAGSPVVLTASFSQNASAAIGTATTLTTATTQPTAFCNRWPSYRMQTVYTAAELTAAGLAAGSITSMAYNITTLGDAATNAAFTVKIGTTALSALTAFATTTSFTTVFPSATYTHAVGQNVITFSTPFAWDGTSNIIVEVIHSGADATNNSITYYTATTDNTVAYTGTSSADAASLSTQRLNVIFTGNAAPAITATSWSDGTNVVGTTNPLTINPTTGATYTATLTALGCTKATNGVTITVNPAPPTPTSFSSTQCGIGKPAAFVNSVSGAGNPIFKWYTVSTGGTAFQTGESVTDTALSISTTTTFYVSESNGSCESPRVAVVCSVSTPSAITIASVGSVCLGSSFNLSVSSPNDPNYTYTWSNNVPAAHSGLINGTTGALVSNVTPDSAASYTYKVDAVDATVGNPSSGCATSATITVTISPKPVINTPTATPGIICAGTPVTLSTTTSVIAAGNATLGTGTGANTTSTYPAAFGTYWGNARAQYLITAAELTAAGLSAGNMTSVKFTVTALGSPVACTNYTVKMGNTLAAAISATPIATASTTVYGPTTYTPVVGVNTVTFSAPFSWDGTSNVFMDICFNNGVTGSTNSLSALSTTSFVSSGHYGTDGVVSGGVCGNNLSSGTSSSRPNMILAGQIKTTGAGTLNWSWDNGGGTGNTVSVTPATTTLYTVTGLNTTTGCSNTATVNVTVNPIPATPTGTDGLDQCGTGVSTASVASNNIIDPQVPPFFKWYSAAIAGTLLQSGTSTTFTTAISTTTTWYVSEVSLNGCESPRVAVTTVVGAPDAITVSASSPVVCPGGSTDISASYTPDFNSFATFTLTASPEAGSGITNPVSLTPNATGSDPITVIPTVTGTYIYTITAYDPDKGCTSINTVSVTRSPSPSITSFTVTPSPVCEGATLTLTAKTIAGAQGGTATVGTATTLGGATDSWTAFNNRWPSARAQLLYTAAELSAAGLQAGNITSIGFNINTLGDAATNASYRVKIGNTALSALTAFVDTTTGFTNVYNPKTYTHTATGVQTITFDAPYNWDGTSNIIVQIAMLGADITNNAQTYYTATTGNMAAYTATSIANAATLSVNRLNIVFVGFAGTDVTSNNTWVFNPGNISGGTTGTATTIASAGITSYTATATALGCSTTSAPVSVTVNPTPVAPTATPSTQCGPAVPVASVSGGVGTYKWYNAAVGGTVIQRGGTTYTSSISTTTHFYVADSSAAGCEGPRVDLLATVTTPPTLVITPATTATFCAGGSVSLNAASASDPSYTTFTWTPTLGITPTTGAVVTATPATTTTYSVNASGGGCINTATITVTVHPNPVITTPTASPATVCAGGSDTLNASVLDAVAFNIGANTETSVSSLSSYGMYFSTVSAALINTVEVYPSTAGTLTIQLLNASGTAVDSRSFTIVAGDISTTVRKALAVNFSVPAGSTGWQLYYSSLSINRGGSSYSYPYTNGGFSITGNTLDGNNITGGTRFYFYNWNVTSLADNSGAYTWLWTPGSLPGNSVIVNPTGNTTYTVKATDGFGCFATSTVSVAVAPVGGTASALPTAVCAGGTSVLTAVGTGGGPFTYLWNDPTAATTATVSVTPTVDTTYTVKITDACGNFVTRTISVTVNALPSASIVEASETLCAPASKTLTASTNAATPSYQWRLNGTDITGATSSTYTINTISTGNYRIRVTDLATGCVATSVLKAVTINASPEAVTIAPLSSTICDGANVSLTASGGQTILNTTLGTLANKNANSAYPAPFSAYYGGQRMQIIVLASELTARGFVSGSVINSIGFPVDSLASNWGSTITSLQNFKVKMGFTSLTALSTFTAGLATYYGPSTFTPVKGAATANLLSFTAGPTWNGTSNLIIETTFSNNISGTVNDAVIQFYTATSGVNSLIAGRADGVSAATMEAYSTVDVGPNTNRPDFVLNGTAPAVITWTPATGLNTASGATVTASPSVTTTYIATSTNTAGCAKSSTVTVTVNPLTAITVPAAPASQTVLQNDPSPTALTLTATGTAPVTYQWYSNTISNNTTGTSLGSANGAQTASYTPVTSALGVLYYYAIVTGGCGPAVTSTVISVNVTNANSWKQGNPTTNWSTPSNWSTNQVPNAATDGIIPNGNTPYPVLTSSVAVRNLTIDPNATITLGSNTFTINGTVSGTGTLTGSNTSNLVMTSPAATVNFTPGANTLQALTVNAGTTTLGNALNITGGTAANTYGTVTVATGATLASGGNLTIQSNQFGTARVAAGDAAGNYITGDVTVERYIPANSKRSWRLLSVPTKGTKTIKQTWQENQAPLANGTPGFGTLITSNIATTAASQAAGFDAFSQLPSMQSYNSGTQGWVYVTSTNSAPIQTNKGYFLYIRGDRSVTTSSSTDAAGATVLRTTGTLYQGNSNPAVSIAAGKFEPVGNTFASAVDFSGLAKTGGISNTFYVWDSKLLSGTTLGAYQTFNGAIGFTPATPGGSYPSGVPNTSIESGEAIMLGAVGSAGTVALVESSKIAGNQFTPFRPASMPGQFKTSLYKMSGTTSTFADNNIGAFDNTFSNDVDGIDGLKFLHGGENMSILRNGFELIVEARQPILSNDTLFFSMKGMQAAQQYKFAFSTSNLPLTGLTAFVEDKFLNSVAPIDLTAAVYEHNFSVDATAGSAAQDRFRIVFKQTGAGPLPVSFINISANHVSAGVEVSWTVAAERSIRQYEIESSVDGRSFSAAGTVTASGRLSYNWLDAAATNGINYYRIKSVGAAGDIKYSAIVKVTLNVKPSIVISPNPVEGAVANLQFKSQPKGRYNVRLLSNGGQAIMITTVEHAGGNSVQTLNLPATIARGAYQLEITSPDKTKQVQTLFINTAK